MFTAFDSTNLVTCTCLNVHTTVPGSLFMEFCPNSLQSVFDLKCHYYFRIYLLLSNRLFSLRTLPIWCQNVLGSSLSCTSAPTHWASSPDGATARRYLWGRELGRGSEFLMASRYAFVIKLGLLRSVFVTLLLLKSTQGRRRVFEWSSWWMLTISFHISY